MPNKKQASEQPEVSEAETVETKTEAAPLCGHVNRHSHGLDRKLDYMTCDLPKGHAGDHSGLHQEYVKEYETTVENGIEKTRVILVPQERRGWWGDMAGIPVKDIPTPRPPEPPTVANLERRLRALETQQKDPNRFINQ